MMTDSDLLTVEFGKKFRRDMKKIQKRPKLMALTKQVIELIRYRKTLPRKCKDHFLKGNWAGRRECHIKPDLLLIYKVNETTLYLERLGSHAELFDL